jgi:hypothetical protein
MTRSDVRTLAWTLRLIGIGMLGGAAALMMAGTGRAPAPSSSSPIGGLHAAGTQSASLTR